MSDEQEFMELATKTSRPGRERPVGRDEMDEPMGPEEEKTGKLVQYSEFYDGMIPTTKTFDKLPPGIYHIESTPNGTYFSPQKVVTDNLLRLPDSKSDEVIAEIERFWTLKAKFKQFGFTHKRGFLLWGPPGSGKTATLSFVSKQLVATGGVVILGNCHPITLSDMLAKHREIETDRPVVVLFEDIDTLIKQHGESQILALLDGESSIDNVVFLATTNYPEELDGRVVNRPSRFDRVVKIDMPNAAARGLYIKSRGVPGDIEKWVELTNGFSIAHIKELIIGVCCFGNDLDKDAERLKKMAKQPKSDDTNEKVGFGFGSAR